MSRDDRGARMNDEHDPTWRALEGLRHSDIVRDARRYATVRAGRRSRLAEWRQAIGWKWPGAVAALGAAVVALVVAVPDTRTYRTRVGEMRLMTLADGSVMRLNTGTRVAVSIGGSRRRVELLAGEVRFDVAHDPARPFEVEANGMRVRAIGTSFDVVALPERTEVTLIHGRVSVEAKGASAAGERRYLAPGQQVRLVAGGLTRPNAARLDATVAWQRHLIDLNDLPLADALKELNRYSSVRLEVADARSYATPVSGIVRAGDVDASVAALSAYYDLEVVHRTGDRVILGPRR